MLLTTRQLCVTSCLIAGKAHAIYGIAPTIMRMYIMHTHPYINPRRYKANRTKRWHTVSYLRNSTVYSTHSLKMVENPLVFFGALLLCLSCSNSWAFYTREKCPPGISHVIETCVCGEYSVGVYVNCDLEGETYERLPAFGQVNTTIVRVTFRNGAITEIPRHIFGNFPVSSSDNLFGKPFLHISSTSIQHACY